MSTIERFIKSLKQFSIDLNRRLEPTEPPMESVQRLISVGQHITDTIGAFQEGALDILTAEQRLLFSRRLAFELFTNLSPSCPWPHPSKPDERDALVNYYTVSAHVETHCEMDDKFTEADGPIQRAALASAQLVLADLKGSGQLIPFTGAFNCFCFTEVPSTPPTPQDMGNADTAGFAQIFAKCRQQVTGQSP